MPIPFQCACGKKMSAKEDFAGRRLRCPDCQSVVTIPKPGSPAPQAKPRPDVGSTPTLTRAEVAAMTQQAFDTPPPSNTMPSGEPDFAAMFGDAPAEKPRASVARPVAKPVAKPMAAALSKPLTSPLAAPTPETPPRTVHPWVDSSMQQTETPWLPGDEDRYQDDVAPARETESALRWIVPCVALAGFIAIMVV
jgi:hypothetical protein